MADGTRMKQMEAQLQQVATTIVDMQNHMGALENSVERRIKGTTNLWREESRAQSARLEEKMREQNQALWEQTQQFVSMLSSQTQVRI